VPIRLFCYLTRYQKPYPAVGATAGHRDLTMIKEVTVYIALSFDNKYYTAPLYSSLGPETRRDILSQHPLRDDPGLDLATRQIQIDMLDSHWRTAFCIRSVVVFPARFPLARDRFPSLLGPAKLFLSCSKLLVPSARTALLSICA